MDEFQEKDASGNAEQSCVEPRGKLNCYNWLGDVPGGMNAFDMVEVQFKNTRKGYYKNSLNLPLEVGDMVAVEASPGHDIGRVSLIGKLVALQMKKANLRPDAEIRRIFRKAKPADLERFEQAKAKEVDTMIRSRQIAKQLKLNMKIGDVEYQGDGNKAIFYYIADERVDFRQLIKVLAETFHIRIEMKQIGARQEAGRIGGIGPCGRPLCCASWMKSFVSVATSAARFQDISLNPQKLAGQCAKLKCCLNYEVDAYVEASKKLPSREVVLEMKKAQYYHFKTDIFRRQMTYSTKKNAPENLVTVSADRVFEVIALNKHGVKPDSLELESDGDKAAVKEFGDILGQDSVTRFDKSKKKKKKPNKPKSEGDRRPNRVDGQQQGDGGKSNEKRQLRAKDGQDAKPQRRQNDFGNGGPRQPKNGEQPGGNRPPKGNREGGRDRRPRPPRNRDNRQRELTDTKEGGEQAPRPEKPASSTPVDNA